MLNKLNELITDLIEKNVLYSFIATYVLSITTCILLILFTQTKVNSINTDSIELVDGQANVENDKDANIFVEISGAIKNPGVFELESGSRIIELVKTAGGFGKDASEEWISRYVNLSTQLQDSQKTYVPHKWDDFGKTLGEKQVDLLTMVKPYTTGSAVPVATGTNTVQDQGNNTVTSSTNNSLLNINTASQEDIDELPGIGPVYAARFIENRPYEDLSDLKEKSGVSESVIDKIKDLITY